jgi:hypothetical protein
MYNSFTVYVHVDISHFITPVYLWIGSPAGAGVGAGVGAGEGLGTWKP